jgi:hypothetical protein
MAGFTFVVILAGIGWHDLGFTVATVWASQDGLQNYYRHLWKPLDQEI